LWTLAPITWVTTAGVSLQGAWDGHAEAFLSLLDYEAAAVPAKARRACAGLVYLRDTRPSHAFTARLHVPTSIIRKAVPLYCVTPRCARRLVATDRPQRGDRPALRLLGGSGVTPEGSQ
jgi:hypothetical protein